ncbi:hypothetical protein Cni_G03288 [Canna indica]|uniref:MULE transposase domain-containing protein n=1 Tax=Canna indica TaxID=4628 RepID=A0AAQ3Q383_9LILI|nr:hypothetical protein Cni_G03288 [Canna indica]
MLLIFEDDTYDIVEEELTNERIREEVEQVENLPFDMFTSHDVVGSTITLNQSMYEAHYTEVGYRSDEENEIIVNNDDLESLLDFTPEDQRDINNDLNEVRGDFDECYKDLPAYLRELKIHDNETTVKLLRCSISSRFLRVFWAFGACLRGFREYLRPIICIDATHLRGKYPRALMIATTVDVESRLFSVAFGVCEIEKRDTLE